ncbi:MAG: segregation/condensation protein A, partial [Candidatus Magasanikbacteria bacterium]|nr:segregation/condensation protein A [Candidatus Magasanikbacteria bacterium]
MQANFKLDKFSGPLDVLLAMVEEKRMSISELALSEVTEQFLNYLSQIEDKRPEDLADFLVVATRLLFIKSRELLPQLGQEEEEGPSLAEQLKLYQAFVEASRKVNKRWLGPLRSIFRVEPLRRPARFVPPDNFFADNLRLSLEKLIRRITPPAPLPRTQIDKTISIKEKIEEIKKLLLRGRGGSFFSILKGSRSRTELIVSFLALLELVKLKDIGLKQKNNFSDIVVDK